MSQLLKAHNQEKKGVKREAVRRKEGGGKKGREKGGRGRETEMGRAVVQREVGEKERECCKVCPRYPSLRGSLVFSNTSTSSRKKKFSAMLK